MILEREKKKNKEARTKLSVADMEPKQAKLAWDQRVSQEGDKKKKVLIVESIWETGYSFSYPSP